MNGPHASTWTIHRAIANLDLHANGSQSDSDITVKIESPGHCNDPKAVTLSVEVRGGPGNLPEDQTTVRQLDLHADDFRALLFALEAAIVEAEENGILPVAKPAAIGGIAGGIGDDATIGRQ